MTSRSVPRETTSAWLSLSLFAVVVVMLGGSSRTDVVQIVALRPLAALFLIPAVYWLYTESGVKTARTLRVPCVLLAGLAAVMVLQLIPLPPSLWQLLPGREPVEAMDRLMQHGDAWRPISMVPARGWNALASLVVPVTALLLAAATGARERTLLLLIIAIGCANALLGIAQIAGLGGGALYFYSITNTGTAVGFFANHNHSAVFSSLVLLVIALVGSRARYGFVNPGPRLVLLALFGLVFIAILIGLSRAGFLMGMIALTLSVAIYITSGGVKHGQGKVHYGGRMRRLALIGLVTVFAGLVFLFGFSGHLPVLDRITSSGPIEDLRWSLMPVLSEMISVHWLAGAGFGAFEEVYHIYEPASLMMPEYLNQAHNDWAQFLIEGGLLAALILILFMAWLMKNIAYFWTNMTGRLPEALFWSAIFAIMMAASLADYPLRTPLFQMVAIWLIAALAIRVSAAKDAVFP